MCAKIDYQFRSFARHTGTGYTESFFKLIFILDHKCNVSRHAVSGKAENLNHICALGEHGVTNLRSLSSLSSQKNIVFLELK